MADKKEMEQEINTLLKAFDEGAEVPDEDAEKSANAPAEETAETVGEESAQETEETATGDQESGKEGEEEEPEDEPEDDELTALKNKIAELEGKLNKPSEEPETPEEPKATLPELKPEAQEIDIFGGQSFNDIVDDEESFSSWAKNLVTKVQEATQESIYKRLPEVIQAYTDQQLEVKTKAQQFYKDFPDLSEHKREVAKSANLIAQAEPGLEYDEFFKKVASHARYMIGIDSDKTKEKEEHGKERKRKPALNQRSAKADSRATNRQPELQGMEKEISDMLKNLDE